MNRKILVITALIFLIVGISAVSAEDINQTDASLEISDSDVISADEPKSFTDLDHDIMASPEDHWDIESDYKFNNNTDKNIKIGKELNIDKDGTFTINGNNHVIDANNQASVFKFNHGTVIINNLVIRNANASAIGIYDGELRTNNVTFENNNDPEAGAAICAVQSNYYSSHDNFTNNYAKNGASIYAFKSIVDINNSTFSSNKIHWSLIYGQDSLMTVNNTLFANMTSRYATAIYSEESEVKSALTVLNSQFINLHANATAGAIGAKTTNSLTIDGCSFINVTSAKNAGAVYVDANGGTANSNKTSTISNSLFENCSSNFGGAYLQLGGKLNIAKTNFTNNIAEYMGGAAYLSNTTTLISNSKFNKNNATQNYGGALYIDDSNCIITTNEFNNNYAGTYGDAIYLHDSQYNIKNCDFTNGDKEAVASFFERKGCSFVNNNLNGGKTLLNQVAYNTIVTYEGKQITLVQDIVNNASKSDSRFDLRDYKVNGSNISLAGVVKDQGNNGACWAFGATGALESAFLKATGILLDLSENNIQGAATRYSEFGTGYINEGGFAVSGMGLFLSWLSVLSTEYDNYDELGKVSIASFVPYGSYHIQDAIIIPTRNSALDNDKLKDALVKYGGLTVHLYGASANNDYYNPDTHAQYYNGQGYGNHFVTLVGWDDNYSKDNFKITPPGDGAWICKNSWGTGWGEDGYFYVSYYDTTFARTSVSVGYIINNIENYTTVYQYDIGFSGFFNDKGETIRFVNTYTAKTNEFITAVGTYFANAGDKYTLKIYVDNSEVYSQDGIATHSGFETIKLNKKIAVNEGHKFSVEFQAKNLPLLEDTRIHFEPGNSMAYYTDGTIEDIEKFCKTACIKAYTIQNENPGVNNSQYYNKNSNLTIVSNANGKTISIVNVTDGKTIGSAIVNDNKASFNVTLEPGSYGIDYGDYIEGFEILNTIEVIDSVKIGYNATLTIYAVFYDEDGIELFGSDIPIILDGKNFTATIEEIDGTLCLNLFNLSIGNHTLILKNPETEEESITTIEVVPRFSNNSNVNMYYADGSSFKVRVYGDNGNPVGANKIVTIKLNKATYKVKTNSNGYAILKIANTVKPGTYTLTATYAGQTIKNTVKVKQVLKLAKVKVKKSAKKLVIKATLKGKKAIKGKKLTFKFNGKKYTAKTNKKGIAKITIKKSVLKKLKKGKKVKYQVTYLKNTVKRTVKVKK